MECHKAYTDEIVIEPIQFSNNRNRTNQLKAMDNVLKKEGIKSIFYKFID